MRVDVIVDDTGPSSLASTFSRSTQFAKAAAAGNQIARVRMDGELYLQLQYFRLRQEIGGGSFEGWKPNKFHLYTVRQWRTVSRDAIYTEARMSLSVLLGRRAAEALASSGW